MEPHGLTDPSQPRAGYQADLAIKAASCGRGAGLQRSPLPRSRPRKPRSTRPSERRRLPNRSPSGRTQLRLFPGASHRAPRRAPRAAGRLPPSRAPTPNSSPQFSQAPYPINAHYPSQSRRLRVVPSVHPPRRSAGLSSRPLPSPTQSAAGSLRPHPNLPPLGQLGRSIPLPAQPPRALKPAGEWAKGGLSTLSAWPIGNSAWPEQRPIAVERGAAAARSGPNIPPPSSRPRSLPACRLSLTASLPSFSLRLPSTSAL